MKVQAGKGAILKRTTLVIRALWHLKYNVMVMYQVTMKLVDLVEVCIKIIKLKVIKLYS